MAGCVGVRKVEEPRSKNDVGTGFAKEHAYQRSRGARPGRGGEPIQILRIRHSILLR